MSTKNSGVFTLLLELKNSRFERLYQVNFQYLFY